MLTFIDTHCHLYAEEFDADRTDVVTRAKEAGAAHILLPNIDEASIDTMMRLYASDTTFFKPMIGLHPTELPPDPQPLLRRMEDMLAQPQSPFVAVGEVGVDLYWDASRRQEQMDILCQQAEWAVRYHLPLMIHTRQAHREVVDTLSPFAESLCGGVFHCFGGTAEEARELLTFPTFALGIGGVVTFKNSTLPEVLKAEVPLTRIVLETDAPYLAPTPYRGKRNEPAYLPLVIHKLSEIYETSPEEVARITTATAQRLFLNT